MTPRTHTTRTIAPPNTPKPCLGLVERTSVMRHPLVRLHLFSLRLTDQLRQALDAKATDPERGSITIEQVAWAAAVIAIVAIAVAAIKAYVTTQVGRL
jgi:hypothetical protein